MRRECGRMCAVIPAPGEEPCELRARARTLHRSRADTLGNPIPRPERLMAPTLRLRAFGDPVLVSSDGGNLDEVTRKTRRFALLIYLTCQGRGEARQRDEIVATFWPESDEARGRNALRQAIFVLRETLGEEVILTNGCQELRVNGGRVGSDVEDFDSAIREGRPERALALYAADFLAGFRVPGCPGFDAWMDNRRTRLKGVASSASQDLAYVAEGRRDLSAALHWWRRALSLRPYDESLLRRIVVLLAGSGNRGRAVAEFERFRRRLLDELEIEPSEETQELARVVAVRLPKHVPMWIGDRRRASPAGGAGEGGRSAAWRRPTDRVGY